MASYDISMPESGKNGWSGQSILLFIYSAIVIFALILVICKKNETPEQIVAEEQLAAEEKRENYEQLAVNSISVPEVYESENTEEAESFDNPAVQWEVEGEETQPEVKEEVSKIEDKIESVEVSESKPDTQNEPKPIKTTVRKKRSASKKTLG